jgi:beta-xylosidase
MFQDDDGAYYLYYGAFDVWHDALRLSTPSERIWVQPMSSPTQKAGEPILLLQPDEGWERHWLNINEGPWMLKRDGLYYLMYSGSAAFTRHYAIGYATSDSPTGPFAKHSANPISGDDPAIFGPGHNSVVADATGDLWLFYHQKASTERGWDRYVCIDPLWFDEDGALRIRPTPMERPGESSR